MKKIIFILFVITFIFTESKAQNTNWKWAKQGMGGGTSYDVATDVNGNVYVTGTIADNVNSFGTYTLTSLGDHDIYLVKYNACGDVIWAKSAGGTAGDHSFGGVTVDGNGDIYIAGIFHSSTLSFGATTITKIGSGSNMFIAKYTSNGTVIWAKNFGVGGDDQISEITSDANGNIYITGYFRSNSTAFGSFVFNRTSPGGNMFVVKFDPLGDPIWANSVGAIGNASDPSCIAVDVNGNTYVGGFLQGSSITFGSTTINNAGVWDGYIVKYDVNGGVLWAKSIGTANLEIIRDLAVDNLGHFYIGGAFQVATTVGSFNLSSVGDFDTFLAKYDSNGNTLWAKNIGGTEYEDGARLATDLSGNVYFTGSSKSSVINLSSGTLTIPSGTYYPLFIVKYDPTGIALCSSAISDGAGQLSITTNSAGDAYVAGQILEPPVTIGNDIIGNGTSLTPYVAKYSCNPNYSSLSLDLTSTDASCGLSNGSIISSVSGGNIPYSYTWNNGATIQHINGLSAGYYSLLVKESSGCQSTKTISVNSSSGGIAVIDIISSLKCSGDNNGVLAGSMTGGLAPYAYLWNNNSTSQQINNLSAGNYLLLITDSNGCSGSASVTLTEPLLINISISSKSDTCSQSKGIASVTASGGNAPYSYLWNNGATDEQINNLLSGNYSLLVKDNNGCETTQTITINNSNNGLVIIDIVSSLKCSGDNNGVLAGSMIGGLAPYTYLWNNNSSIQEINNLSAGNYSLLITDSNGCSGTAIVTLTEPLPLDIIIDSVKDTCNQSKGMLIGSVIFGTSIYTYNWSNGGTDNPLGNLSVGTYSVVVTDSNGCEKKLTASVGSVNTATANAGTDVTIEQGESVQLLGTGGGTYEWVPLSGLTNATIANPIASPTETTTYTLIVTDAYGCTAMDELIITVEKTCINNEVFIPNALSPNKDGNNDVLYVRGVCIQTMLFSIYNRWGEKIFETTDLKNGWDGTYKGKEMEAGVYAYYIDAVMNNKDTFSQKGNITLIK